MGRIWTPARRALPTVVAMLLVLASAVAVAASGQPAYLDSHRSVGDRVADLLGRMTLAEKVGQMDQIEVTQVTDTNPACTSQGGFNLPNPACEQKVLIDNHAGSLLAGATDIPPDTTGAGGTGNTGRDWATE
jgi:beta-glucosidase